MGGIRSAGVGSGLDVENIIGALMAAERQPLSKIREDKQQIQTKLSIYGVIKNSFSDLQNAAKKLTSLSSINPMKASTGDDKLIGASASADASKASYSLEVSQLARSQSIAAPSVATADTVVGQGSITITLGSYASVGNTFTPNASKTPVTINIGPGQDTLEGVRQAINAANAGVSASIINDGTGSRLILNSTETGLANGFKLEVADNDGTNTNTSGLSRIAYDPTLAVGSGKNSTLLQASQNANFKINGLDITKTSNTVSDAVKGVTFTLKSVTTAPVTVDVGVDDSAVKSNLDAFVSAYNKLRGNLKDQQQKDATLSRETTPAQLERSLRGILRETVSAFGLTLNDIGMSFDKDGVLSLNKTKLDERLATDPKALEKLFSNTGTTTDARVRFLGGTSKTLEGTYAVDISSAGSTGTNIVGTLAGVSGTGLDNVLTGGAGNGAEGLQLSIVEGQSGSMGTVTFSKGLASRLNEWIDLLNAEGGTLASRTEGLNSRIRQLDKQTEQLNVRLDVVEKRYRNQFSSLDSMLAGMRQTSTYLSQQLSALQR